MPSTQASNRWRAVLDDLERSLLEIVHSPSRISAADLEQIRRRIDAAALLFKVRVMSDELRQRERSRPERPLRRQQSTLQNGGESWTWDPCVKHPSGSRLRFRCACRGSPQPAMAGLSPAHRAVDAEPRAGVARP